MSTAEFGDPNLTPAPAPVSAAETQLAPLTISAPAAPAPEPLAVAPLVAPAPPAQPAAAAVPVQEMRDVPLGTLIFREGLLTEEQLQEALQDGMQRGKRLGEVLLERGLVSERDLGRLLAGQKGLPFVELDSAVVDPAAVGLLPAEKARLHTVLPIGFKDGLPVVAVADPSNDLVVENVRRALNCEPHLVVAGREALHRQIELAYAQPVAATMPVAEPQPAPAIEPALAAPIVDPAPAPAIEPQAVAPIVAPEPVTAVAQPVVEPVVAADPVLAAPAVDAAPQPPAEGVWLAPPPAEAVAQPVAAEPVPAPAVEVPAVAGPAPIEPVAISFTPVEPQPVADPAPAVEPLLAAPVAAPDPVTPEPVVAPTPEPVAVEAVTTPEPVTVAEPPVVPETPAAEPAAETEATHAVVVRLSDGERLHLGDFGSADEARAHAERVVQQLTAETSWPFLQGRFIRPDAIVSVDLEEPERTWLGSAARRAAWQSGPDA